MNIQVPGEGPKQCKIAFVGEAPGEEEVRLGRPFVGWTGTHFDRLLAGAGIIRSTCYITNTLKVRPPNNDTDLFIEFTSHGVKPTIEFEEYRQHLFTELSETTANVIVPLGAISTFALLGDGRVGKLRGSILPSPFLAGRKVIPTFHPSTFFYKYLNIYSIIHDLKRVKEESEYPELRLPSRTLHIRPSFSAVMSFLNCILEAKQLTAFDIEVTALYVSCISFSIDPFESTMSIPFFSILGDYWNPEQETAIWKKVAEVLEAHDVPKVAQNAIFDSSFLMMQYGIKSRNLQDTMIAHAILYPELPKGLHYMTSTLTREPYYKDELKSEGEISKVGETANERFWLYNAKDSAVTLECFPKLMKMIDRDKHRDTYERAVKLIPPVNYMMRKGMRVYESEIRAQLESNKIKIADMQMELNKSAGMVLNHNSPTQMRDFFYKKLGHTPYQYKGKITTNVKALKRLFAKGCKEAGIVMDMRKLSKETGTYLEMKFDSDGRLRCLFNIVGTKTGRWSSCQSIGGFGSNIQNIPRPFRRYVGADDGYLMIEVDYSQADNRVVAYTAPEPTMIKAFEEGTDLHKLTYALMFDKRVEDVSREEGSSELGDGSLSERDWGKKFNHALNYDQGYRQFSINTGLSEEEAKECVRRYHQVYPNVRNGYHIKIQQWLSNGRTFVNPYGRWRVFLGRMTDETSKREVYKEAYATYAQSTIGDKINNDAIIPLYYDEKFHSTELLNQVHDSILFQVPLSLGAEKIGKLCWELKQRMEVPVPALFPVPEILIPVEFKFGTRWGLLKDGVFSSLEEAIKVAGKYAHGG